MNNESCYSHRHVTSNRHGLCYAVRCGALTLAEALKQQEAEVAFICREHKVIKQQLATLKKKAFYKEKEVQRLNIGW